MSTKKTTAKKAKIKVVSGNGKISGLDAAIMVLSDGKRMHVKELTEAAMALGWKPAGKTPAYTLSAAIQGELKKKGTASRFRRGKERGEWMLNASAKAADKKIKTPTANPESKPDEVDWRKFGTVACELDEKEIDILSDVGIKTLGELEAAAGLSRDNWRKEFKIDRPRKAILEKFNRYLVEVAMSFTAPLNRVQK